MTPNVLTVEEDGLLIDAVELFLSRNVRRIPVVRDRKVVGVISRHDVVRYIREGASTRSVRNGSPPSA